MSVPPKTAGGKEAILKNSQFKSNFTGHKVEQSCMVVKYNKGIRVLFWFILMYKGRKETNFKGFASSPDFRPRENKFLSEH